MLDDQQYGEGSTSRRGLTLALHMLHKQKSFHMLKVLLTDRDTYSGICAGIKCLQPCHESALKVRMDNIDVMILPYKLYHCMSCVLKI